MRTLPVPPPDFLRRLQGAGPEEIDVSSSDLPTGVPIEPSQWVACGPYGAAMHDDLHLSERYSILLVVHALDSERTRSVPRGSGWKLSTVGKGLRSVLSELAGEGSIHFLDIHRPHALHHEDGYSEGPWVALAWNFENHREALRAFRILKEFYQCST